MRLLADIHLRDPFVLPVPAEGAYYLFGTTDEDCWGPRGTGFDCFRSRDLMHWEGPQPAFRPAENFWADHHFWAPEVYPYQGHYVMFASFKAEGRARGTQVLQATHPAGPYTPMNDGPVTPGDWECLDGTLHLESPHEPWMVFCREWKQVVDGTIEAMPLSRDLCSATGAPITLFAGSSVPWSCGTPENPDLRVTDGPWLHRAGSGVLWMLWSTLSADGYTLCLARSASGSVIGPWIQSQEPLFHSDGGHAMIFRRFDGQAVLTLHRPNRSPRERPVFFLLNESEDATLQLDPHESLSPVS